MQLRHIPVRDVQQGKNWRFLEPPSSEVLNLSLTDWGPVIECDEFDSRDLVVYSGVVVLSDGRVLPTLTTKEVGDLDYGGDSCVFIDGNWQVLGPHLGLGGEIRDDYFANPLDIDPSFDSDDGNYREEHREGFRAHRDRVLIGE